MNKNNYLQRLFIATLSKYNILKKLEKEKVN
jgi:hypothetical protein